MSENDVQKWYYDTKTGQVSQGKEGTWENRMGPYDSREEAQAAIEAERKQAVSDLQKSVADISVSVASKLIGTDLSDDEHRAIIKRYVEEAGSFNAS